MKTINNPVKFIIATFTLTYTSWLIFMYLHFRYGVKVFDDSPFGMLMLMGLFSPSIVGVFFRLKESRVSQNSIKFNKIAYLLLSVLLPIGFVLIETVTPQILTEIDGFLLLKRVSLPSLNAIISAFVLSIIFGGLEELGWRAYLLPHLLQKLSPSKATLILAFIWSIWHLPLFYLPGSAQYQDNFAIFVLSIISLSSIMTFLWIKTQSVLLAVICHATFNTMAALNFETGTSLFQLFVSLCIAVCSLALLCKISKPLNAIH